LSFEKFTSSFTFLFADGSGFLKFFSNLQQPSSVHIELLKSLV